MVHCHISLKSVSLNSVFAGRAVASLLMALALAACQSLPGGSEASKDMGPAGVSSQVGAAGQRAGSHGPANPGGPSASSGSVRAANAPVEPAVAGLSWVGRPRLVLAMVVDGLPQRQLLGVRDQLAPDGFNRFLGRGAWYADAHHGQAFTVTAVGHAAFLTGTYPERNGIIANEWRDAQTGQPRYCTGDPDYTYIGRPTQALDGTSPRNLRVNTVGDMLRDLDPRARVIGVSGKDRGAILPAGHKGTAYMYQSQDGSFASTTYYMKEHPAWVEAFNAARPADRWFHREWRALLPEDAYARSLPDRQPWYASKDAGLPMLMGPKDVEIPGPAYYTQLLASPYVDQLTLDFARAAVVAEGLGRDDVPDVLTISLSGHDYVNHRYSAESRLSQDHLLQLDRQLQEFFHFLDKTIGRDRYVAVLTADHGFMPAPEVTAQQGLRSGRISGPQMLARINAALEDEYGPGKWVSFSGSAVLINRELLAQTRVDPDEVAESVRDLLMDEPAVATAYTRRDMAAGLRSDGSFYTAVRRSWNGDVSGDVPFVLKPYWMFAGPAATHGSPYPYDTQVPLLAWGPRWVRAGRVDTRVEVVDIAPTVSQWLGIAPPPTTQGKSLPAPR